MLRIARIAGGVGAAVALSGCWAVPGQNPDRTAHNGIESKITPSNVSQLTQAWAADAPWLDDLPGADVPAAVTDPVVSSQGVHAVYGACAIGTYRPADGTLLWEGAGAIEPCFQDPLGEVSSFSPPFVSGPRVAFGWTGFADNNPNVPPPPILIGGTHEFDTETGAVPAQPVFPGANPAAVRGDTVVSTSPRSRVLPPPSPPVEIWMGNGRITIGSLTDSGDRRFFETEGTSDPTLGAAAIFQSGGGTLATTPGDAAVGEAVRAFSLTEARPGCGPLGRLMECPLWAAPIDGVTTDPVVAPDQSTVYVGTNAGTVYAVDAATGSTRWTAGVGATVNASPALADGTVYVPTADGRLVALAAAGCGAATCAPLWEAATGSPIGVQPAVAGGVVFTGSGDGSVDAFPAAGCGAATCSPLWSAETGGAITGAPAVSNGQVYVGTADGRLIAYRLS